MEKTKKTKPAFIVDLTNVTCPEDIQFEVIKAKAMQGVKITKDEVEALVRYGVNMTLELIDECMEEKRKQWQMVEICNDPKKIGKIVDYIEKTVTPKDPWYKRAWNWLKKPFSKKK